MIVQVLGGGTFALLLSLIPFGVIWTRRLRLAGVKLNTHPTTVARQERASHVREMFGEDW